VVIVTGLARKSKNAKTGDMLQTWILHDDVPPIDALRSGKDQSICGSCPLRGFAGKQRGCYVRVDQAPTNVWKAYKRGAYQEMPLYSPWSMFGANRAIRLGSYGDPVAVPLMIWDSLISRASNWTGYTHQWHREDSQEYRHILMASVESFEQMQYARIMGWRTFRIGGVATRKDEIHCPATAEGGFKAQCETCGLCKGVSLNAANIVLRAHGRGAKYV